MKLFFKLAWRNVLRNRRRSFIAGIAIGVGLASLMLVDAITLSMERTMLRSATASFMGEAQIHREGFRDALEVEKTIVEPQKVMDELRADGRVRRFTPRTLTLAMITSPANLATVTMVGVDPTTERDLSEVDETIVKGSYFVPGGEREILIGTKLADLLEVDVGDRIVLTVAQAHTGDLSQELFRVSGIYFFNVDELDRGMAFIRLETAQAMLGLPGDIHQIAIDFTDMRMGGQSDFDFWARFSQDGNVAEGWRVLMPELSAAFELVGLNTLILGVILFGIVSLGIMNTLFMSLYERMFEFGVMRAVGTRPWGMARLVLLEAGGLSFIGVCSGAILGVLSIWVFQQLGIDYSGIEFAGATMREVLYPIPRAHQFTVYPLIVFLFTTLVGLYPALYAARLIPAVAMRRAM